MSCHITELCKLFWAFWAFIGLVVFVCLDMVLKTADFAENLITAIFIAYEDLIHTLSDWIPIVRHGVVAEVDWHHVVLWFFRNGLFQNTTCLLILWLFFLCLLLLNSHLLLHIQHRQLGRASFWLCPGSMNTFASINWLDILVRHIRKLARHIHSWMSKIEVKLRLLFNHGR